MSFIRQNVRDNEVVEAKIADGVVTPPKLWGGGRVREWEPVHETLLDPTLMAVDGEGAPTGVIVNNGITVTLDRSVTSVGAVSLKITIPQDVTSGKVVLPTPGGRVLGESVWRVRCDAWDNLTAMTTYFYPNATAVAGDGDYKKTWLYSTYDYILGFRQFPAVWDDTWRNVVIPSGSFRAENDPIGWGDTEAHKYLATESIKLKFTTKALVGDTVFYIDRITVPVWPGPAFNLILDHYNGGSRQYLAEPLMAEGIPGVGTILRLAGEGYESYPSPADIDAAIAGGWAIIPHYRGEETVLFDGTTHDLEEFIHGFRYQRHDKVETNSTERSYLQALNKYYAICLSNSAFYDPDGGTEDGPAAMLRSGITFARTKCADPTIGLDPRESEGYTSESGFGGPTGWIQPQGPYMHSFGEAAEVSGVDRNTFASYLPRLTQMMNWNSAEILYAHNTVVSPGVSEIGIDFANGLVEWLLDNKADIAFTTPMDIARATYLRSGPVHLNHINEWVNDNGDVLW